MTVGGSVRSERAPGGGQIQTPVQKGSRDMGRRGGGRCLARKFPGPGIVGSSL